MRWGKTRDQRHTARQELLHALSQGVKRFAWYPIRLEDMSWIWLQNYYAYLSVSSCLGYLTPIPFGMWEDLDYPIRKYAERDDKYIDIRRD